MSDKFVEIKKKMATGVTLGSWLQLPDSFSAEIMARAGFDWLAIDLEHGLIDIQAAFKLIQVVGLAGAVPLVRLHYNDPSTIRRVMDAGAAGVIVPMVNTAEDARAAVDALKYPAAGKRSFGLGRAHEYGGKFDQYVKSANAESLLVVQIEHIDAVKNLGAILKIKEIDAIIIGPYDLSGSMGIPGNFEDDNFRQAIDEIILKVKASNKALGIHIVHPSEKVFLERVQQGFTFIAYGMDTIFLSQGAAEIGRLRAKIKNTGK